MWSYCSNFRVIRACFVEVPSFYHLFDLPYSYPIMRTSSGPNRPSGLRIKGSSTEEHDSGHIGEGSGRLALVVDHVPPAGPPSPSRIEPSFGKAFATRYRPPFGVHV